MFTRSGSTWSQQGPELQRAEAGEGGEGGSCEGEVLECAFGGAVALSSDGSTALVGAAGAFDHHGGVWVFTRSGSSWTQQGPTLTAADEKGRGNFGRSVALSADGATAVIGGPTDHGHGAAWVFDRSGGTWSEDAKLLGAQGEGPPRFGRSVAVSGDGDTVLIGGPGNAHGSGAAWVFTRGASSWQQEGGSLAGAGESAGAQFGFSVALSADASTALVGARGDEGGVGAAWAFARQAGGFAPEGAKLTGGLETGAGRFGSSVALSADGATAIVGGLADDAHVGAAWQFTRTASTWTQLGQKLLGGGESGKASFGASVALSADGSTSVVGGFRNHRLDGAAWIFEGTPAAGGPPPVEPSPGSSGGSTTTTTTTQLVPQSGTLASTTTTLPAPVFGKTSNIEPAGGKVFIKLPGAGAYIALSSALQVPFGTIIDATNGKVVVTTARLHGGVQRITFYAGKFRLTQTRSGQVIATLVGGNFSVCPTARERSHLARISSRRASGHHVVRKLWANGHGSYSTKGNYATGAVLGTRWLTEDLCEGTLIRVITDKVLVRNLLTHRHRTVRAGHHYLVKVP